MRTGVWLGAALAVCALAADRQAGLPARPTPQEYPSQAERDGVVVAAQVMDDDTVRSSFATDLYRRYAVVEVAIYPAQGKTLDIADVDFGLKYAGKSTVTRAASPVSVAGALQRRAAERRDDITLFPSVGVGVGNDPYGGTRTGTNVGVGVGVGGNRPGPASTPEDRRVITAELEERALRSGPVSKPVAGYLYFPLPSRKNVTVQELTFELDGTTLRVPLRPAANK